MNKIINKPASNEIEVSIFGPGYGEALAIHIGGGDWILVDSCQQLKNEIPAQIEYLNAIHVNLKSKVKLVIATHWHDDHVKGISKIFAKCSSANFVISSALNNEEFLTIVGSYLNHPIMGESGIYEFANIVRILEEHKPKGVRYNPPKNANADKLLYSSKYKFDKHDNNFRVFSLSPSDAEVLKAKLAFMNLIPTQGEHPKWIKPITPNHAAVVLWLELGETAILLGSDLEETADPSTGWTIILDESQVITGKGDLFKIPHHGSKNAHQDRVWQELLINNPNSLLAPFTKGRVSLPTANDVKRIKNFTDKAFITAPTSSKKQKFKNKIVNEFVKQVTKQIHPIHLGWGHVRARKKFGDDKPNWKIDLFGDASKL